MGESNIRVDVTFDVRTDAGGRDPDSHSRTLRSYHQALWSKRLPSGQMFHLDDRLRHESDLGSFTLTSDAITNTYSRWTRPARLANVVAQIPTSELAAFYDLGCTIGAYLVFPSGVKVDGKWMQSINQRRGTLTAVCDRFDLTLECIRRQYVGIDNPLADVLDRHADFFGLFETFPGYVDHFLLNDLVEPDYTAVRFLKDFDDFSGDALPASDAAEYREYAKRSMEFIRARNARIAAYAARPV